MKRARHVQIELPWLRRLELPEMGKKPVSTADISEVSVLEPQDGNPGATRCTESSDSEEGDLEIEMLPQPVEILQAEKSG